MLAWVVLFLIVTGNFGKFLGIPYLFLDPEYLNKVNFVSCMWIGAMFAGFAATAFSSSGTSTERALQHA